MGVAAARRIYLQGVKVDLPFRGKMAGSEPILYECGGSKENKLTRSEGRPAIQGKYGRK